MADLPAWVWFCAIPLIVVIVRLFMWYAEKSLSQITDKMDRNHTDITGKVDGVSGKLVYIEDTVQDIQLQLTERPTFDRTHEIAEKETKGQMKDHIIDKHMSPKNGGTKTRHPGEGA